MSASPSVELERGCSPCNSSTKICKRSAYGSVDAPSAGLPDNYQLWFFFFSPFKTNFHWARFRFLASSRGTGTHATTYIVQLSSAFLSRERKITASDWCTSATPPSNYRGRRWLTRWSWQQRIKVALKRSRWFISSLFFCVRASESKHLVEGRGGEGAKCEKVSHE